MTRRSARMLGVVGAALVALVLTHSLVFLVRYGSLYGEALAHSGHDVAWTIAVLSAAVLGVGLALAGAVQLARLARAARGRDVAAPGGGGPSLGRRWLVASARLTATTAVLLTIQENLERAGAGLPIPGVGLVFSAEYPSAVVLVALVGLAVGLVVALFQWRRDALIARLRAGGRFPRRAPAVATPGWLEPRPETSLLGRAQGLRAPPEQLAS